MRKREARAEALQRRGQLKRPELERLSEQIARRFLKHFGKTLAASGTVHIFLSIPDRKEVNTNYLIDGLRGQFPDVQIATSYMTDFDEGRMETTRLDPDGELIANRWGVPEPVEVWPVEECEIDLLVVPLLAFDTRGGRIGYGKGFYDRFLARCRPEALRVGVSVTGPIATPLENVDEHDVPLHHCVTPERVYDFSK
ncbi:MAG: 5-formyltetrahydrofolate cyclo-ligase [Catalinimonas sp.]